VESSICPDCGAALVPELPPEAPNPEREMTTKAVYKAPDEFAALTIQSALEAEGITSEIRSFQMPMYDGIAMMQKPFWGEILVLEKDFDRGKRIVADFLSTEGKTEIEEREEEQD
jgi:hypothetical protein